MKLFLCCNAFNVFQWQHSICRETKAKPTARNTGTTHKKPPPVAKKSHRGASRKISLVTPKSQNDEVHIRSNSHGGIFFLLCVASVTNKSCLSSYALTVSKGYLNSNCTTYRELFIWFGRKYTIKLKNQIIAFLIELFVVRHIKGTDNLKQHVVKQIEYLTVLKVCPCLQRQV